MFQKKQAIPAPEQPKEKPTPAFLRPDYPYQATGDALTDLDDLEAGALYEIKCPQCEMSLRTQGQNIKTTFERFRESGCIGCGNKALVIRKVDMTGAPGKS
ncbi:MAG: hypothetical protein IJU28_04105 [Clostridia bacterium]|nr:hypothetical protein [Clostridia bacterium]